MIEFTAGQVISYILAHKYCEQCFPGWDRDQITQLVINHIRDQGIAIATEDGKIIGVILYNEKPLSADIFVEGILTSSPKALPVFVAAWERDRTGWRITAHRAGKPYKYNISHFARFIKRAASIHSTTRYADINTH